MKNTTLPAFATLHRSSPRVALSLLALLPVLAASTAFGAAAQTTLVERNLPTYPIERGTDVAPIDDLDGDNIRDILIWSRGVEPGQLATVPFVVETRSGLTLERIRGYPVPSTWASAMGATPVADRDGDGIQDIAIHSGSLSPDPGEVRIVSSATGQLLTVIDDPQGQLTFGGDVLDLGDVNGDGVADLAVSEPARPGSARSGAVHVISGATGARLYLFTPPTIGSERTGEYLSLLGDLDGDGVEDFAATFRWLLGTGPPIGFFAVSGATGALIWNVLGGVTYGESVAVLDDMDSDGTNELAVVRDGVCGGTAVVARASVLSGATGTPIFAVNAPGGATECDDLNVARIDDLDDDGFADLAISQRYFGPDAGEMGRVALVSSATGATLGSVSGRPDASYGFSIASAMDINEDGVSELIVGGGVPPTAASFGSYTGSLSILSPVDAIPLTLFGGETQFDNSTGTHTTIGAVGSAIAADNDVTLFARNLAPGSFGYFLTSLTPGSAISTAGRLYIVGEIGRFNGAGQIQAADTSGKFFTPVDLNQWPTPTGFTTVTAGQTWYFQAWGRDQFSGQPASRFSDRLEISFE